MLLVRRGPDHAWDPRQPTRAQREWDAHASFMDRLAATGLIRFGGPIDDGGAAIAGAGGDIAHAVAADDAASIRARLAADPWERAGTMRTTGVDPWTIWVGDPSRVRRADDEPLHLVTWSDGPHWRAGVERRRQPGWERHAAFVDALERDGVALCGGPLDPDRAALVMRHSDAGALRDRLSHDPWHAGVLSAPRIERWTLWL